MNTTRIVTKKEAAENIHTLTSVDISKLETSTIMDLAARFSDLFAARECGFLAEDAIEEIYAILKVPTSSNFSVDFDEIAHWLFTYINLER